MANRRRASHKAPMLRNPKVSHLLQIQHQMEMLGHKHFLLTLLAAMVLHLVCYGIWSLMPKAAVVDIPVRALNIKLGDGDIEFSAEELAVNKPGTNSNDMEHLISRAVSEPPGGSKRKDTAVKTMEKAMGLASTKTGEKPAATVTTPAANTAEKAPAKSKPFDMRSEGISVAAPVQQVEARQFVRDLAAPDAQTSSVGNGNSAHTGVIASYEQLISSWIDKFKPEKMASSSEAPRATALVLIRIDRRGNIRYVALEKSSDSAALDRAALDTVRRANPVPPVPADYPAGDLVELKVPVVFVK